FCGYFPYGIIIALFEKRSEEGPRAGTFHAPQIETMAIFLPDKWPRLQFALLEIPAKKGRGMLHALEEEQGRLLRLNGAYAK
ncbi:hypothetical protein, partial [Desulfatibacillum aliphaticivorans]|uniref:hypothetical protein n=1 Tax=Desulfatibacillum aliphaticivorans TaxID=218208 RepID=UPI00054EBF4C